MLSPRVFPLAFSSRDRRLYHGLRLLVSRKAGDSTALLRAVAFSPTVGVFPALSSSDGPFDPSKVGFRRSVFFFFPCLISLACAYDLDE